MKARIQGIAGSVLFGACALLGAPEASAISIDVTVVNSTTIELVFSGTLSGPTPNYQPGLIFIDAPVLNSVQSSAISITGNYVFGSGTIDYAYSGYNNPPYAGGIQLRYGGNGENPLALGDVFSGTATLVFNVDHGLNQSMFDGGGSPVYWGRHYDGSVFTAGTLQGYTNDSTSVPEPGTLALLGLGLLGLGVTRRKAA